MNPWIFSSNTVENIEVARERLLWGFWDREAGEKQKKNWRPFIRLYNRIKPFDIVFFQRAKTGEIHAVGIVKETYYDDQTPVWPQELEQNRVLFPWRVAFCTVLFSEKPFVSHYAKIESYVDGYGVGELSEHELRRVLAEVQKQLSVDFNLG